LSDSITVWLIDGCACLWWIWRLYLYCLTGIASCSDVSDHFEVLCMWLDGGLIWCTCLYNSLCI
jgi:hypothetical protein